MLFVLLNMGTYYGVKKVVENGQRIGFAPPKQPSGIGQDVLVGIMNDGLYAIASDLTKEGEYQNFYNDYAQGIWLNIYLYTVPREKIKDCPDEGKVLIRELEQIMRARYPSK